MTAPEKLEQPQQIDETFRDQPQALTPVQDHFLHRLEDLARKREELLAQRDSDPFQRKLLARAIYATLMDCVGVGVNDRAQAILSAKRPIGRS